MCKGNNLQPQGGKKGDDSREGNEGERERRTNGEEASMKNRGIDRNRWDRKGGKRCKEGRTEATNRNKK